MPTAISGRMPAIVLTWDYKGEKTGGRSSKLYHGVEIITARRRYRSLLLAGLNPRVEKPDPKFLMEHRPLPPSLVKSPASPQTLKEIKSMSAVAIKKRLAADDKKFAKTVAKEKAKTTTKKATKKATKPAKPKRDRFGVRIATAAGAINAALSAKAKTVDHISKASGVPLDRCKGHMQWMVRQELATKTEDGSYKLTSKKPTK